MNFFLIGSIYVICSCFKIEEVADSKFWGWGENWRLTEIIKKSYFNLRQLETKYFYLEKKIKENQATEETYRYLESTFLFGISSSEEIDDFINILTDAMNIINQRDVKTYEDNEICNYLNGEIIKIRKVKASFDEMTNKIIGLSIINSQMSF